MRTATEQPTLPTPKQFQRARNRLAARIAADKMQGIERSNSTLAVSDPVITPFLQAMKEVGYLPQTGRRGSLVSDRCARCSKPTAYTFLHGDSAFRACATCRDLA